MGARNESQEIRLIWKNRSSQMGTRNESQEIRLIWKNRSSQIVNA